MSSFFSSGIYEKWKTKKNQWIAFFHEEKKIVDAKKFVFIIKRENVLVFYVLSFDDPWLPISASKHFLPAAPVFQLTVSAIRNR